MQRLCKRIRCKTEIFICKLVYKTSDESFQSYNPARRAMCFIKQGFKDYKDFLIFLRFSCAVAKVRGIFVCKLVYKEKYLPYIV